MCRAFAPLAGATPGRPKTKNPHRGGCRWTAAARTSATPPLSEGRLPRSHCHGGGAHLKAYDAVVPRGGGLSIGLSAGVSPFIAPPQRTCHQHDPRPASRGAAGRAAAVNTSTPPASHHADSPHEGCTTRGRACRQRERPIAGYARHRASSRQRRRGTSADDRGVSRRLARAGRPARAAQRRSRRCDAPLLSCFWRGGVPPTPDNLS